MTGTNLIMAWGLASFSKKRTIVLRNLSCQYVRPSATTGGQIWLQQLLALQWHGESPVAIHCFFFFLLVFCTNTSHSYTNPQRVRAAALCCRLSLFPLLCARLIKSLKGLWLRSETIVHNPGQLMLPEYNGRHLAAAGGNKAPRPNMGGNGGREPMSPLALLTLSKHFDMTTCLHYLPSANLLKAIFYIIWQFTVQLEDQAVPCSFKGRVANIRYFVMQMSCRIQSWIWNFFLKKKKVRKKEKLRSIHPNDLIKGI